MFKKTLTSLLLTFIGVGGFFVNYNHESSAPRYLSLGNNTYAADCFSDDCNAVVAAWNKEIQNAEIQKMLNTLVAGINIVLSILTIIVSPAIMLASWLMSPDWTAWEIFGLRPVLHSLWITVSNITYLIYAILLIVIALATIFNSEHYGYRAMLPKLALGIIMVPLTWWGVQFTISLATYVTAVAVSVPAEAVEKFTQKNSWWEQPSIPTKITYRNNAFYSGDKNLSKEKDIIWLCGSWWIVCTSPKEITSKTSWLFSPLMIYSFWVFKIQNVKLLDTNPLYAIQSIIEIVHQWIIGALMFIIYGLLVLALIFMLLMRAMKLWVYAIFSPLFTIKYVLGEKAFGDADKDGSFTISQFIGLAFVPAVVSLALSFWLVIIAALHSPLSWNGVVNENNKCEGEVCTIKVSESDTIVSKKTADGKWTETTITFWWVGYTFEGSVQWWEKVIPWISSALSATGNLFGTIIIDIIALVFIWIAFMAGTWISKAAGKAIEPFANMGKKIGELGMSLPKYAPIPGTGGLSMKSMEKVPRTLESAIETSETKRFEGSTLWRMLHADQHIPAESVKQIKEWINLGTKQGFEKAMKDNQAVTNRPGAHNAWIVEEFMKKIKEKPDYMDTLGLDATMKWYFREYADKDLKNEDTRKKLWWYIQQSAWIAQNWSKDPAWVNSWISATAVSLKWKEWTFNLKINNIQVEADTTTWKVTSDDLDKLNKTYKDKSLSKTEFREQLIDWFRSTMWKENAIKIAEEIIKWLKDKFKE